VTGTDLPGAFAERYGEARDKFLDAAQRRSLRIERHVHPAARGADGEELSIDVAVAGDDHARSLLVLTSGMHGVEGFCGSGCQVALLRDSRLAAALTGSVAVLICHAVNPYGFSHLRRANEDNVDLNRNFRDFNAPLAPNSAYAAVHAFIVPPTWPPDDDNSAQLRAYVAQHGMAALQSALTAGQSEFPDGLFYTGRAPAWSNTVLRDLLARHGANRSRLGWIDFHTGLGAWGHGEKIYSGPDDAAMIARARRVHGVDVTTYYDGTSTSARVTGAGFHAAVEACPHAEYTGIALEYGTLPLAETLQALRAEQWLAIHPEAGAPLRGMIKRQMRDAFYDGGAAWQGSVYGQARVAVLQALQALGADPA
jgi:predicted deacylase